MRRMNLMRLVLDEYRHPSFGILWSWELYGRGIGITKSGLNSEAAAVNSAARYTRKHNYIIRKGR